MKIKWKRSPDFAEIAEALAINTDQVVLARVGNPDATVVIYTPDKHGAPPCWRAELARDADGILVVVGTPRELSSDSSWS